MAAFHVIDGETPILRFADVEGMIQPPPSCVDEATARGIMSFRRVIYARRVDKVNDRLDEFMEVWPKGRPIDFFIALEASNDNIADCLGKLYRKKFRRAIQAEARQRGVSSHTHAISLDHSEFYTEEAEDDAEWSPEEVAKFKEAYVKFGTNFPRIAWEIPTRNARQCKVIFGRLREAGDLPAAKTEEMENFMNNFMVGLTFTYKGRDFELSGNEQLLQIYKKKNPIPGTVDKVTGQLILFPAMSPDGYVLDYFTWKKLLESGGQNPFTDSTIYSMDELILLTVDNFDKYKDRIQNLDNYEVEDYYEYEDEEDEDSL